MAEEKTYLELSEAASHKFYEVIVRDNELSIRFGRIGDAGQTKVTKFATAQQAKAEAQKKLNEKLRKGYAAAVMGVRKKREVTRRSALLNDSSATTSSIANAPVPGTSPRTGGNHRVPIIWHFQTGTSALGIFINQDHCWVGNEDGEIYRLDHSGKVDSKLKLPEGVKCIVADGDWLYAGCDDGNVYDLTGKVPYVAYQIAENVDIYWLDIKDGILAVSDALGNVNTINHEDESQWMRKSAGTRGWMVRCDEIGIYHGHSAGVTMYDWEDGQQIWEKKTQGMVNFGWQEEANVYACTHTGRIHNFTKRGEELAVYKCDSQIFSCATSENGKYIFAGDLSAVYCFQEDGQRLWKLDTDCGAPQSMQFFQDRLYIVTHRGYLACIDASEAAIQAAQAGNIPKAIAITAPAMPAMEAAQVSQLETTSDTSKGVMVQCFREGNNLRIKVISPGYNQHWHCQFPKDIREEGARYLVDEIRDANGFYRAFGNIRKII